MSNQIYWHWPTFIMFICMGLMFVWAYNYERRRTYLYNRKMSIIGPAYMTLYIAWLLIGVFRLIDSYHGGTDTPDYIELFQNILNPNYSNGVDWAFKQINVIIRHFTSDYHVFLFIIYAIMLLAYVKFVNSYSLVWANSTPLFLISYLYYVGFSSMRSNLAFCVLLIALAFYVNKQYKTSIILAVCSCLTHVSLIMYAPVLLFCYLLRNHKIKLWQIATSIVLSYSFGLFLQQSFISGAFAFFDNVGSGAYASYAAKSLDRTSLDSFIIVNFPSICMGASLIFFINPIQKIINALPQPQAFVLKTLLLICIYDVLMVPITFSLGVYRGYMYLMVARLLMWGVLMTIIRLKFKLSQLTITIFGFLILLIWIYTRYEAMYESSQLMPYIFDLF